MHPGHNHSLHGPDPLNPLPPLTPLPPPPLPSFCLSGWNENSDWDAAPAGGHSSAVHNSRSSPALTGSGGSGGGPSSRLNSARDRGNNSAGRAAGKAAKPAADEDDEWGKW